MISIIVNCYNGDQYLKEALDSIYEQTYENWEIIFFDNQSNDKSATIAKSYDTRLKYHYNKINVPLGQARRLALEFASGEWIAFLDVDDIWHKDRLKVQTEILASLHDVHLLYAAVEEISPNGSIISINGPRKTGKIDFGDLLKRFDINIVTALVRRSFLEVHDLKFDDAITASEEYNLFMRCAALGNVYGQSDVLGKYRISANSLTDKKIGNWAAERFKTISDCLKLKPELLSEHPALFIEAIQKGIYYQAQSDMHSGKVRDARRRLKFLALPKESYFVLYLLSFSRSAWNFLHIKHIKIRLSTIFRKMFLIRGQ